MKISPISILTPWINGIAIGGSPSMLAPLSVTLEIRGMNAVGEEHWRKWRVLSAHTCVLLGKESGLKEV